MKQGSDKAYEVAAEIIAVLRAEGHVALLAGGCVRDQLMNVRPKDYDVATDATPARVQRLFPRARRVGAMFGVMLVHKNGCDVEIATFRADGNYSDGRHPDEIRFGTDVDDARRRDFTINGLFLDPSDGRVIDHVGGLADIAARIVRTIGDAATRFGEDHLRLIRAIRFSAKLGFAIEEGTWKAIVALAGKLRTISPERIWQELDRMLIDPSRAVAWRMLMESGLREHLSVHWPADSQDDVLVLKRLAALPSTAIPSELGLAATLASRFAKEAQAISGAVRLSNRLTRDVTWLVRSLPVAHRAAELELADLKFLMANEAWPSLGPLLRADLIAKDLTIEPFDTLERRAETIDPQEVAPPPLLTGDDLVVFAIPAGPAMGKILTALYRAQLNGAIVTRDDAIVLLKTMKVN